MNNYTQNTPSIQDFLNEKYNEFSNFFIDCGVDFSKIQNISLGKNYIPHSAMSKEFRGKAIFFINQYDNGSITVVIHNKKTGTSVLHLSVFDLKREENQPSKITHKVQFKARTDEDVLEEFNQKTATFQKWTDEFNSLRPLHPDDLGYLFQKKVIREAIESGVDIRRGHSTFYSENFIMFPVTNGDQPVTGYQKIYDHKVIGIGEQARNKDFRFSPVIKGQDVLTLKNGSYVVLGDISTSDTVYITEGFSTGLSVYGATKQPVAVAIDAGNIKNVTAKFVGIGKKVIIAGDYDANQHATGQKAAWSAALEFDCDYVLPSNGGQSIDWNDAYIAHGSAIQSQIRNTKKVIPIAMAAVKPIEPLRTNDTRKFNVRFNPVDQNQAMADLADLIRRGIDRNEIIKEMQSKYPQMEGWDIRVDRAVKSHKNRKLSSELERIYFSHYKSFFLGRKTIQEIEKEILKDTEQNEILTKSGVNFSTSFEAYAQKRSKRDLESNPLNCYGITTDTVNSRFLELPVPAIGQTYIVKSSMGTGKTYGIEQISGELLKNGMTIIYLCHRVSLSLNAAKTLKFEHYQENKSLKNAQAVAMVINSAVTKDQIFKGNDPDVVIIDEIDQVLAHIASKAIKNPSQVLEKLAQWVKNARIVIAMSADIDQITIDFIRQYRNEKDITILNNEYRPHRDTKVTVVKSKNTIYLDVFKAIHENIGCTVIATNGYKTSRKIFEMVKAQFPNKKGFIINKDNSDKIETKQFLTEINQKISDYDYFIYSPSIGSGVSIESEHVTSLFGYFHSSPGFCGTASDAWQQLGRVRSLNIPIEVFIEDTTHSLNVTEEDVVFSRHCQTTGFLSELGNAIRTESTEDLLQKIKKIQNDISLYQRSEFDSLSDRVTVAQNQQNEDMKYNFVIQGMRSGRVFSYDNRTAKQSSFGGDLRQVGHERYSQCRSSELMAAEKLTKKEFQDLLIKPNLKFEDRNAIERHVIEQSFRVDDISTEVIALDNDGEGRRIIANFELVIKPQNKAIEGDYWKLTESIEGKKICHFKSQLVKREFITRLMDVTSLYFNERGDLCSRQERYHAKDEKVVNFAKWVISIGGVNVAGKKKLLKNPVKFIGESLKNYLGISTTKIGKAGDLGQGYIVDLNSETQKFILGNQIRQAYQQITSDSDIASVGRTPPSIYNINDGVLPLKKYVSTLNHFQGKVLLFIDDVMEVVGVSYNDAWAVIRQLGMEFRVISNDVVEVVVAGV